MEMSSSSTSSANARRRWRNKAPQPINVTKFMEMSGGGGGMEEAEALSPAARMFHESNFNVHVVAVFGSKTRIDPQLVKDKLSHSLLRQPRFSSLQVTDKKGTMRWVPTEVDISRHVIVPNLDPNIARPDQFLENYIANLSKTHLDRSKPLWDLHILNLKTSAAEAAGILRVHHSLGDGTSLISLLLAFTHKTSDPQALPTVPVHRKRPSPCRYGGWWRCLVAVLMLFRLAWNSLVDVGMLMATGLFLKDTETPLKAPPGAEVKPRRIVYRTVSLDDMKLIKNAMNMDLTINDVGLAVTQAGLSRYLNRRYGEINKVDHGATESKNNLPKNIRLRSTLLINLRPSAGIQAFADMMKKETKAKWGNWVGFMLLPFTIALRDDPLDYVRQAKATIDRKKHSLEPIFSSSISDLVLKLFGIKTASALSHGILTRTSMCFSNLVGPVEEIAFYGHPMTYLAPGCYGQPHGLMINFQSYINKMTIVLSVDESTIPDPHQLLNEIEESLQLIKKAVQAEVADD
ncbi:wax ester synthase/diacylglycerol acyltransferase 11-like [Diospyros lotus]|uniref:wax ester synthase/diacylglycerol acyltransferase 11-like n=1 Tax=Diospyros lotus TaxID=55363 RepID=UPI00224D3CDF|nr:wax ester synthase/diacylglycerol acyltransferase 11-like [Diospyros lotus]